MRFFALAFATTLAVSMKDTKVDAPELVQLQHDQKLVEIAAKQSLDLEANVGDIKKFRKKNKELCAAYFKFLDDKREGYDIKQNQKKEKKAEASTAKSSTSTSPGLNKKIKFDEDDEAPKGKKLEKENKEPFDIGKTMNKIDKKLKKEKKPKSKKEV